MENIFNSACEILGADTSSLNINLNFVDIDEIRELNKIHRGKDTPTDVLSFPMLELIPPEIPTAITHPFDVNPETQKIEMGDIVICEAVAKNQADEFGHSIDREIAFLYTHGMLHLFGYCHDNDDDEKVMNDLCEKILGKVGIIR